MLWSTIPLYTALLSLSALLISGWEVYLTAIKRILRRDLLDEAFLMSIASIAAFCIGEYVEGVAVILFYRIGEYFEHKAVRRSRQAIRALMDICADTAILLKNGEEIEVDADEVGVGDTILLRPGDRVPCDAIILDGSASLDTSALTGESLPRDVVAGDSLLSGCIVLDARLIARVTKPSEESSAARVLAMVEEANERKSRQERLIASFSRIYTPIVVALALLIAFIPPLLIGFTLPVFTIWLRRALMLLVVSCPCALVISVPLAFFGGIGNAAARGILFKGGSTFDALAHAKIAVFDKTGTLTSGAFVVSDVKSYGVSEAELLYLSASA
jgi:Cd2+/Zn2+-exporting ATPase